VAQQPNNILSLGQVRKYAQHFIFWRRGIAIPPLHARDVYILSPNADMSKLPVAAAEWARAFPFAPALPAFLAKLSEAPKPYKSFCPSKSYRPGYLQMLAWLMRSGLVTQLCTFAYVVAWPEVIYEVEYAMEADELNKAKTARQEAVEKLDAKEKAGYENGAKKEEDEGHESGGELTSSTTTLRGPPGESPGAQSSSFSTSESSSSPISTFKSYYGASNPESHHQHHQPTAAEQAAERARLERIAEKAARELAEKETAHARKVAPTRTDHPSLNEAPHLSGLWPHIILDARKPTGKESLYLSAIGKRLRERKTTPPAACKKVIQDSGISSKHSGSGGTGLSSRGHQSRPVGSMLAPSDSVSSSTVRQKQKEGLSKESAKDWDSRVADAWPVFLKYFDGRSALERIALQEEMKRKEAWNLLTAMGEYLLCVRHW